MEKVLQCDCGFEARGEHDHELVAQVRRHALQAHGMALSREEAAALASRAQVAQTPRLFLPDDPSTDNPTREGRS